MISVFQKKAVKLKYTSTYPVFSWKTETKGRPRFYFKVNGNKSLSFFIQMKHTQNILG